MKSLMEELRKYNKCFYLSIVDITEKFNIGIESVNVEHNKTTIIGHPKDHNYKYCGDKITIELSNKEYYK